MSQRRFLAPALAAPGQELALPPEEASHARKVLRLNPGDRVQLLDGAGGLAWARLIRVDKRQVLAQVEESWQEEPPRPRLVLCPGLAKGPAMDLLAARLTELMVNEVRPFTCARSVPVLKDPAARVERWQRLAGQALKQCGAAHAPAFHAPLPLQELLVAAPGGAARIMLYEDEGGHTLAQALAQEKGDEIWLVLGPEGGFAPQEVEAARAAGFTVCGLPGAILRAETACLAVAAVVRFGGGAGG